MQLVGADHLARYLAIPTRRSMLFENRKLYSPTISPYLDIPKPESHAGTTYKLTSLLDAQVMEAPSWPLLRSPSLTSKAQEHEHAALSNSKSSGTVETVNSRLHAGAIDTVVEGRCRVQNRAIFVNLPSKSLEPPLEVFFCNSLFSVRKIMQVLQLLH